MLQQRGIVADTVGLGAYGSVVFESDCETYAVNVSVNDGVCR